MWSILGFEPGEMFAPFGRVHSPELFAELLRIPGLVGLKDCSRERVQPEFKPYTGNDLTIDMVMCGSDHRLGLATFAPDAFALRDRLWAAGDARFFALNDVPEGDRR